MDQLRSLTRRILRWFLRGAMVLAALPIAFLVYVFITHFVGRSNFERHAREWADLVAREAPVGTAQENVERLFASRGMALSCNTRGNVATCRATERERFGMLPEWFLRFEATFEDGGLVRIVQTRLGVGL